MLVDGPVKPEDLHDKVCRAVVSVDAKKDPQKQKSQADAFALLGLCPVN